MQPALLYTTFPDIQAAEQIASQLLDERLIACVNLLPNMVSLYVWQGKNQRSIEVAALLKTDATHLQTLMSRLKALHPYDVPCMMNLNVDNMDVDYLSWMTSIMKEEHGK
jgi:periplasmic divalent cation tolerance protein